MTIPSKRLLNGEPLSERERKFLGLLADLCDEYKAEFGYTNYDDGIHISVDNEEVFVGHLLHPAQELRAAAICAWPTP